MDIFSLFKTEVLYLPDSATLNSPYFEIYQKILKKLKIKHKILDNHLPSINLFELGYENLARNIARKNFEIFKQEEIKKIITNSPEYFKMLLHDYPKLIPEWNIEVLNLWDLILEKLEKNSFLIKEKAMEIISFHDNCYLGRYCETYESPRKILEYIGYQIDEMENNKQNSMCCGTCGGLIHTNPELADELAKERIQQAKRLRLKKLAVCSVENYNLLKKNSKDIEILELSELLAKALNIEIEKTEEEYIEKEEKILEKSLEIENEI